MVTLHSFIKFFFYGAVLISLHSCFLIKIPIAIKEVPLKDTVHVYHFIVSDSRKKAADSLTVNSFKRESTKAYNWISREARRYDQTICFKEHWVSNKDTAMNYTFAHKLPAKSIKVLTRVNMIKLDLQKKGKTKARKRKKKYAVVNWRVRLFDSIASHVKDSSLASKIRKKNVQGQPQDQQSLMVVHLLKVQKSKFLGFYKGGKAFIGNNRSETIAHESLHHLGATDAYVHRFWPGRRRKSVVRELKQEIMNGAIAKNYDCTTYYLSNYTAYTIGWTKTIHPEFRPILKENLMARFVLFMLLLF